MMRGTTLRIMKSIGMIIDVIKNGMLPSYIQSWVQPKE